MLNFTALMALIKTIPPPCSVFQKMTSVCICLYKLSLSLLFLSFDLLPPPTPTLHTTISTSLQCQTWLIFSLFSFPSLLPLWAREGRVVFLSQGALGGERKTQSEREREREGNGGGVPPARSPRGTDRRGLNHVLGGPWVGGRGSNSFL